MDIKNKEIAFKCVKVKIIKHIKGVIMDRDYEDIEDLEHKIFKLQNKNYELENKCNKLKENYKSIKIINWTIIIFIIISLFSDREIVIEDYSGIVSVIETKYWGIVKNYDELKYSDDLEGWEIKRINKQGEYYWDEIYLDDYYSEHYIDDYNYN